ncbi:D-glycero-alpha-D-manno-heptose 1-phosphate guanylyltransferase [Candidatus Magnetomoraceae bacterium gMMP-15]
MRYFSNITAIILAGGLGTRLRSVVADRPKVMAEVHGKPFLVYLMDQISAAGLRHIVLCTGYLGEQIQAQFGKKYKQLHLTYSQEKKTLGTAGALSLGLDLFESDPVLVMNGDSFCEVDLREFIIYHHEKSADASLILTRVPDTRRYGRVLLNKDGLINKFEEKNCKKGSGWINAGIYMISHKILRSLPKGEFISLEQDVLPNLVGKGVYGFQSTGHFIDIGIPESYAEAENFFIRYTSWS